MTIDDRFASYTRSASFALTLSSAQIAELLALHTVARLRERYDWYCPHQADFGTAEELAVSWSTSTVRALARKGLIDVTPVEPPCSYYDVIQLSIAGELMAELLLVAGFEPKAGPGGVPLVGLHPDDRIKMRVSPGGQDFVCDPAPPDRRWPVPPEDQPFMSLPVRRPQEVAR